MADEEHVALLKQGVEVWNRWRKENPAITGVNLLGADLAGMDLRGADLRGADLQGANLKEANFSKAKLGATFLFRADLKCAVLREANLHGANLTNVDLTNADLSGADLTAAHLLEADLSKADLSKAKLNWTDLSGADVLEANLSDTELRATLLNGTKIRGTDLSGAILIETIFSNIDLSDVRGLEKCHHFAPSSIDFQTLHRSGPLPLVFLRGVGLPELLIDYLPSLLNQPIQFYSVFISYSSKDQDFADRLYADLQNKGVRCWFAPHDMPIGAKIIDAIDEAIRLRDKVLLILSENSAASDWVEGEVTRSLDEERERKQVVLFPVRIDDTVLQATKPWTRLLRGQRNIGDFSRWKDHDAYQKVLERLLRDLTVTQTGS